MCQACLSGKAGSEEEVWKGRNLGGGGGELRGMNRNQIILIIPAVYKVVWFSLSSVRWLEEGDW